LAFLKFVSELNRDAILSRIVNQEEGKLQTNFYLKLAEAGAADAGPGQLRAAWWNGTDPGIAAVVDKLRRIRAILSGLTA